MALSATNRGTGNGGTANTTFGFSPSGNFAAGSCAALIVSIDNPNGASPVGSFAVTDTKSNTWTRRVDGLQSGGGADLGVEAAVFTTAQNGGTLTTVDTITVSWTTTAAQKVYALVEIAGTSPTYSASATGAGAASTTPTITTSSLASGDLVLGAVCIERGGPSITADSDTTNGSWSAGVNVTVSSGSSGQTIYYQTKVTTGAGTQTYNPTLPGSYDHVPGWVSFAEGGGGGGPTVKTLAALGVG